jgi:ATP-binding cassette, subfamily C, bacterial LapB
MPQNQPTLAQPTLPLKNEPMLESDTGSRDDPLLGSLALLLRQHGIAVSEDALIAGLPVQSRLSPELFLRVAQANACKAAYRKRALHKISDLLLPVVLELQDGEACVLLRRLDDGKVVVLMPQTQDAEVVLAAQTLAEQYAGSCYWVQPEPRPDARSGIGARDERGHWLWRTLWRYKGYYVEAALAALLINVLALAGTFFTMNVYDRVVSNQAYVTLWTLAIGVAVAVCFEFVARNLRGWVLDHAGKKADLVLGATLFRQALMTRLDHRAASSGSFANNLREFESVRDFFTSATLVVITDLPFLFLFIWVIGLIAGPLMWVPLLAIPLIAVVALLAQFPLARYVNENMRESSLKHGLVVESIEGAETLKALRGEGFMQAKFEMASALTARTAMKSRFLSNVVLNWAYIVQSLTSVAMVVWGVYLIGDGKLTMGALVASVMLSGRALAPVSSLTGLAVRLQQTRTGLGMLNKIMRNPTDREAGRAYVHKKKMDGALSAQALQFAYSKGLPEVLHGLDFQIQAGERMAILGRIGSGKSTLLRLLSGMFKPTQGSISVDGLDLQQIEPADVRRNVVFVGQDARLFYGTLRENLKMGNPLLDDEEMVKIATLMGVHQFASAHPRGYDMPIGESGEGLSGGQRQAVALARAMMVSPAVLLLDEPTSAMDNATEQITMQAITRLMQGRTLILVTHKLQLLSYVERVMVIDAGQRVADGPKQLVMQAINEGKVRGGSRPVEMAASA